MHGKVMELAYNPEQPRDDHGRWTGGGAIRAGLHARPRRGTLILYHHTTTDNARRIMEQRRMTSPERDYRGPLAFFTTERNPRNSQAAGRGGAVVQIQVPEEIAQLEDEFPGGEQHYSIPVSQLRPEHFTGKERNDLSAF